MMEMIEFMYNFSDDHDRDTKRVIIRKQSEDGLTCDELCEAFIDFMEAAGFNTDCVYEYFDA